MARTVPTEPVPARSSKPFIRKARELHLYLGTFFAPAILFFAFTGILQVFDLHSSRPGGTYQPPRWIQVLAQIHKKQVTTVPPARPEFRGQSERRGPPPQPAGNPLPMYILKWFVVLMALGLMTTTILGIYMAFKFNPGRRLIWLLLVLGTAVPLAIILL